MGKRRPYNKRPGLYSIPDTAKRIGTSYMTLYNHIAKGYVAPPTRGGTTRKFYNEDDVQKIIAYWRGE